MYPKRLKNLLQITNDLFEPFKSFDNFLSKFEIFILCSRLLRAEKFVNTGSRGLGSVVYELFNIYVFCSTYTTEYRCTQKFFDRNPASLERSYTPRSCCSLGYDFVNSDSSPTWLDNGHIPTKLDGWTYSTDSNVV